jgi:putative ABC transport system permease protein
MSTLLRFWAIFVVTIKRIFAQRGLALATSLGIVAAVALTMSVPIYSDAVYQDILQQQISGETAPTGEMGRPPFAFMYRYVGAWNGAVDWERMKPVNDYLSGRVRQDIGLPARFFVRYFKTDSLKLFPAEKGTYDTTQEPLAWVYFSTLTDLEKHATLLEGSFAPESTGLADSLIDVMISEERATLLGAHVGERFIAYTTIKNEQTTTTVEFPVRIAGIWKPTDPKEDYWFYSSQEFRDALLVPEGTFFDRVIPYLNNEVYLGLWYWVFDGSRIHSADVPGLLGRIFYTRQTSVNLLPNMRLDISPEDNLTKYLRLSRSLTIFLYAFSVPLLIMILTFIGLVVDMAVGQRRNEIAVLRSRGSTTGQLVGMAILESLILGAIGMLLGAPLAQLVAQFFGKARSFLDFSAVTGLKPAITPESLRFGLVAVTVAMLAMVLPTLGAAKHTVITYKQDRARQIQKPFWQRAFLDFLLLIPAGYGMYLLQRSGDIGGLSADPFQNPLLLLVPALGIFAVALLVIRFLPLVMRLIAWVASQTNSVGLLMAARYLSRSTSGYTAPLILLVMTLSLSTFTATLAQTLDRHMHDQTFYKVGADVHVIEMGQLLGGSGASGAPGGQQAQSQAQQGASAEEAAPIWVFMPVSEHLKVPGVQAAARVARIKARLSAGESVSDINFIGIDRIDFPQVAFWRRDFATVPLGALMNDLARTTEGVLVSYDMLQKYNLKLGDTIGVSVYQLSNARDIEYRIVGTFYYFPTWYPEEGPLVVGNLDYLFEQVGGEFPYDVWLRTAPGTNYRSLLEGIDDLYRRVMYPRVSLEILNQEQLRPERQGFFGLLSVGFVALAFLTVLGFLLYAFFSFRRRFIELGMLRAIGLSAGQMLVFLASELAFLFLSGLAAGTGMGVWVSNFFIPHLQVGNDMAARIPPFLVRIDWPAVFQVYILFGVLFVIALAVLGWLLMRMKVFQAIKLGEAV